MPALRLRTLLTLPLSLLLAGALSADLARATPDDEQPSVVVLTDGQTLEGIVRIEGPTVRIIVKDGAESAEIVLAAESVESIDPRDKPDQIVEDATVRLKDGRRLRGRAIRFKGVVRVQGAHGEVEVRRDEVLKIEVAEPPRSRLLVDGDLGIALPVPKGWSEDEPTGLGERLRVVDEAARCFVSVVARTLPEGDSTLAQVRAALLGDLGPRAQVSPRGDLIWIEDEVLAAGSAELKVRHSGAVHISGDLMLWFRASYLVDAKRERREATDALAKRIHWIKAGVHESAAIVYAPKLGLLLSAPAETKLLRPKEGPTYRIAAKGKRGVLDVFHLDDDPDPAAAIQDRVDVERVEESKVGGLNVFRARAEGVRAIGYRSGQGSVILIARAKELDLLQRLTNGARLLEPAAIQEEIARDTGIARQMAEVRLHLHEERPVQADRIVRELLTAAPEDPGLLSLAIECRRVQDKSLSVDLDDLYSALGAEWIAKDLSSALLDEGRAYKADEYVKAASSLERAAQVWPSDEIATEVQDFFVTGAEAAFKAGDRGKTWARLARARRFGSDLLAVDKVELGLRLDSADLYLKEKKPGLARREARRGYELGGDVNRVERIYAQAERIQMIKERESKIKKRGSGGGFRFGLPPSQVVSRQGRIRRTAFTRPTARNRRRRNGFTTRSRRIRNRPARRGGQRRVRRYYTSTGGSRRARVRSRARVLFQSRS
jgi:hypothetical protein